MEQWLNRKNNRIAHIERKDSKAKTVIMMYDDEKGGGTTISQVTLKKNWRKVTEENNVNNQVKEENQEVASDGTPYTQVMKEIVADGEKAKKAAAKKKAEVPTVSFDEQVKKITALVKDLGYTVKTNNSKAIGILNSEGKQRYGIYLGGKKCVVMMAKSHIPEGMTPDRTRNCPLAAAFDVNYENLDKIKTLIKKEEK